MWYKYFLPVIIIICFIALIAVVFLIIRNSKLQNYKDSISKMSAQIVKNNSNNRAAIARIKHLSKDSNRYQSDLNKLEKISKNIEKITIKLQECKNNFLESLKKYNLTICKKNYLNFILAHKEYIALNSEFSAISDTINKHLNVIENVVLNSFELLNQLDKKLDANKNNLSVSYPLLKQELVELKGITIELESQKNSRNLRDVSSILTEQSKRLTAFAEKISHIESIEWLIFKYLPKTIEKAKESGKIKDSINSIENNLLTIQASFKNRFFQDNLMDAKKMLNQINILIKEEEFEEEFKQFATDTISNLKQILNNAKQKLDEISQKVKIAKNKDISQYYEVLNNFETQLNETKDNDILQLTVLVSSIYKFILDINKIIYIDTKLNKKSEYLHYLLRMLEVWYIKIISMKNSMENSMENQAKFNELIHIYETLQQTQVKLTKFDIKQLSNKLIEVYQIAMTSKIYYTMSTNLINKLLPLRLDNENIDKKIRLANSYLKEFKYKQAFKMLHDTINKEKLNVHKNIN